MNDLISRQAAIRWVKTECNPYGKPTLDFESGKKVIDHLERMPSARPTEASCWGCNCTKMERMKEQKTFSEMVHLHDTKTHGRLIDADALLSQYHGNIFTAKTDYAEGLRDVIADIKSAPTIIPADPAEE